MATRLSPFRWVSYVALFVCGLTAAWSGEPQAQLDFLLGLRTQAELQTVALEISGAALVMTALCGVLVNRCTIRKLRGQELPAVPIVGDPIVFVRYYAAMHLAAGSGLFVGMVPHGKHLTISFLTGPTTGFLILVAVRLGAAIAARSFQRTIEAAGSE